MVGWTIPSGLFAFHFGVLVSRGLARVLTLRGMRGLTDYRTPLK